MSDGWAIYGPPVRGRACGSCQACCCTMVPVDRPLDKPAGVRCKHLCARGCRIYASRPEPCRYWNCAWLYQEETADMRRPDRAGYLIDPMLQEILIDGAPVSVIQVWVDPERPDAHMDPALRAYLDHMGERHKTLAIVRWSHPGGQDGRDAMVLVPACLSNDGVGFEKHSAMISEQDMAARLERARNEGIHR